MTADIQDFADYYDVLGIDPSASEAEVEAAITAAQRTWRGRQGHPQAERRAEADRQMLLITRAEQTLTDPAQRRTYDELREQSLDDAAEDHWNGNAEADYWLDEARTAVAAKALEAARHAVDNAVQAAPTRSDTWLHAAEIHFESGRPGQGIGALRQAAALDPCGRNYLMLGQALLDAGDPREAFYAFAKVWPTEYRDDAEEGCIRCYLALDLPELALPRARDLVRRRESESLYRNLLGWTLVVLADGLLTVRLDATTVVTSQEQLEQTRAYVEEASASRLTHADTISRLDALEAKVMAAGQLVRTPSDLRFLPGWRVYTGWFLLSLLLLSYGTPGLILAVLGVTATIVFRSTRRIPQYRIDRRTAQSQGVQRWGI